MPPVERSHSCGCCFFLSYRWELTVSEPLLYNVFLKNWDKFDPKNLKDTPDILWYWMATVSFGRCRMLTCWRISIITILQLDQFCRKQRNGYKCQMCCSLFLCETCKTYVLRVQIWVWNLQLPPVLLLCPCIWGSQLNRLRIRAPFQEGLPQSW